MALKFLIDLLTGNLVLVQIPSTVPPTPPSTKIIPIFFFMIPQ